MSHTPTTVPLGAVGTEIEFEPWYRAEFPRVLGAMTMLCGDPETARDCTAEAFARALERWSRVGKMESPGGWTYRVALNTMRRRGRRAALEAKLLRRHHGPTTHEIPLPEHALWDAVRALPDRQRTAIALRYVADLPEHEIATAMGVSPGTVASTLHAARKRLAEVLGEDFEAAS